MFNLLFFVKDFLYWVVFKIHVTLLGPWLFANCTGLFILLAHVLRLYWQTQYMNQDTCFSDSPEGGKWRIEINHEKGEERTPTESVTLFQCSHDSECTCASDCKKCFFKILLRCNCYNRIWKCKFEQKLKLIIDFKATLNGVFFFMLRQKKTRFFYNFVKTWIWDTCIEYILDILIHICQYTCTWSHL